MIENLVLFDTTLRDGEQSPGISIGYADKLELATSLNEINVDIIEVGFASSSSLDFLSIQKIAPKIAGVTCCSLSRANAGDIWIAASALKSSKRFRVHTFIATSDVHVVQKLKINRQTVFSLVVLSVRLLRHLADDAEFSAEDSSRTTDDLLIKIFEVAICEGTRTLNVTDTVGFAVPEEFGKLVKSVRVRTFNSDLSIFSVHCHNDLGLAVANTISGVQTGGARQMECTINGLGERAGNASFEELVMIFKVRSNFFGICSQIESPLLLELSSKVVKATGFELSRTKPIVGSNAFSHSSGIHQDGIIKDPNTYEIMEAKAIGRASNRIVLGKLSGCSGFKRRLDTLGIKLTPPMLKAAFIKFKTFASAKDIVTDEDLFDLMGALGCKDNKAGLAK